jgi:transposase-like protein
MQITITRYCLNCQSAKIKKNGRKISRKQNYLCKTCGRLFIGDHSIVIQRMSFQPDTKDINVACPRMGIRNIAAIEKIILRITTG